MKDNLYPPTPVAYGQSCINMNTDFSCRNNCIYCFGKNWKDRHKVFQPDDMIKMLPNNKIKTIPIGINNSASDPFQPKTINRTLELCDKLQGRVENVMIITKEYVSPTVISFLESMDYNIFMFISYSGLPKEYEPLLNDRRLETLKNLQGSKLNTILYARPLIKRINDFDKIIEASKYVKYMVWSSVRVDNNNAHKLLPEPTGENLHKSHKRISNEDLKYIEEQLDNCNVKKFRKTSCVISYILKIPDYNAHWTSPELYGCERCDKDQVNLCMSQKEKIPEFNSELSQVLKDYKLPNYKYSIPGAYVLESNMKQFSCLRAGILRKITGFQVMFEWDNEIITAENLAYKYYELRGEKEGNIQIK